MRLLLVLLMFASFPLSSSALDFCPAAIVRAEAFDAAFRGHQRGHVALSEEMRLRAIDQNYFFVDGFLNEEWYGNYFRDNLRELERMGARRARRHQYSPSSSVSFEENLARIDERLRAVVAESPNRPLVLIGHSRGAALLLAFALRNPDFIERYVRSIFLIQAALGGSGIADFLSSGVRANGVGFGVHAPLWVFRRGYNLLRPSYGAVTVELRQETSAAFWEDMRVRHADAIPIVSPRVNYIVSSQRPSRMSPFLQLSGHYLQAAFGDNDGLVLTRHQFHPWIGQIVLQTIGDHSDFVLPPPISSTRERVRRSLTRAMVVTTVSE